MDDISLGLYPGLRLCPLDLTTNHGLLRCPSLYCGASLDSFSQAVATSLPTPPPPHPQPPARPPPQYAGPKLVHTFKKTI